MTRALELLCNKPVVGALYWFERYDCVSIHNLHSGVNLISYHVVE